jgi:hypothetical protein
MRNEIRRANSATASVSAKPSIPSGKTSAREAGLRLIEATSEAKMLPMPAPTPASAITARPAPIILAEARSMERYPFRLEVSGGGSRR